MAAPSLSLFAKARALTSFLLDNGPLPLTLEPHGRVLAAFVGGISVASGLGYFFQAHRRHRDKVQLAIFHVIRVFENLPDKDERLQDLRQLVQDMEREVALMIPKHLELREADTVVRHLKRTFQKAARESRAKKRQKNSSASNELDNDVVMTDAEADNEVPTRPSRSDLPVKATRKPSGPSLSRRGLNGQSPRHINRNRPSVVGMSRPPSKMAVLTRNPRLGTWLPAVPEGLSPQASPAKGVTEYRVAETRGFYSKIQGTRRNRRAWRDAFGDTRGPVVEAEEEVEDGAVSTAPTSSSNGHGDAGESSSHGITTVEEEEVLETVESGQQSHSASLEPEDSTGEGASGAIPAPEVPSALPSVPKEATPPQDSSSPAVAGPSPTAAPVPSPPSPHGDASPPPATPVVAQPDPPRQKRAPTPGVRKSTRTNAFKGPLKG